MKFKILLLPISLSQISTGSGHAETDDEIFDPLADIYEEFFEDTNCFMSEKLYVSGQASKSGLTAYENIESGELLIKMTRECAICPSEILDYFPFIKYLREIWKKFHGTDHDDILTLVSYLLLTDLNSHMSIIPDYHDYLVNYPLFWKADLLESLPDEVIEITNSHRDLITTYLKTISLQWPYGKLTDKNLGAAFYQVRSRAMRLYDSETDQRIQRGELCFFPGLEMANQNSTSNAVLADQNEASILLLSTEKIAADKMIVYDKELDQMVETTEEYRLVNRGYMLNQEYFKYHFEENGLRIFLSSKHFNFTCQEYLDSAGLKRDCEKIIAENWPGYGAGRSQTTLFYGRTGTFMNAAPELVKIFNLLDIEVYHQYQILDKIFESKINKHSSYFSLERPFASDFKVWYRQLLIAELKKWRNLFARANQFRKNYDIFVFPDFAEECGLIQPGQGSPEGTVVQIEV